MIMVNNYNPTVEDLLEVIRDIALAVEESGSSIAYDNLLSVLEDNDIELD